MKSLSVVGFGVDVEVFKYTFEFLRRVVGELGTKDLEEAKKKGLIRSRRTSFDYKFSFCTGCSQRLVQRIKSERESRLQTEVTSRDLVVLKKAQVSQWVKNNMRLGRGKGVNLGHNGEAYARGERAADSVRIRTAIQATA